MLTRILMCLGLIVLATVSMFPCSIPQMPPSRSDISQNLFVGQVTGYTETTELINRRQSGHEEKMYGELANKTAGIVVKVKQSFYTTSDEKQVYEIYRFSLGADCGLYGLPIEWMKERYKIGDWVTVAAGDGKHIAASVKPDSGRLEIRYGRDDAVTVVGQDDPSIQNFSSAFDYKAYRSRPNGNLSFEILKDLRRLHIGGHKERVEILDRLTYSPNYFPSDGPDRGFWLEGVFISYSSDMKEFETYSELVRERAMTKEEFERYEKLRNAKKP